MARLYNIGFGRDKSRPHGIVIHRQKLRLPPQVIHRGVEVDAHQPTVETAEAAVASGLLDGLEERLVREVLGHRAVAHIAAAHPDHLRDVPLVRLRPKLFCLHFSLFYNDDAKVQKRANISCWLLAFS